MENLQLVTSGYFEDTECQIYSRDDEMYMTINQLANALGYADRKGIEKIIERNQYLYDPEFSTTDKLTVVEGKRQVNRELRMFTEDGVYEVTFLSKAPNARAFRAWVRKLIKAYRRGELGQTQLPTPQPETALTDRLDRLIGLLEQQYQMPQPEPLLIEDAANTDGLKDKKLLTKEEAAEYLHVGTTTFSKIINSPGFYPLIRIGHNRGKVFINREKLEQWLNEQDGSYKELR